MGELEPERTQRSQAGCRHLTTTQRQRKELVFYSLLIPQSTWVGPCKEILENTVEGMFLGQRFSNHLLDALKTLNVNTNI